MGKGKNSGKQTARMPAGKFGKLQKKMEGRKGVAKRRTGKKGNHE